MYLVDMCIYPWCHILFWISHMWKIGLPNWLKKTECSFEIKKKGELQELKTEKKENATGNNA